MDENKAGLYIVAIVAIIAVLACIVLVFPKSQGVSTTAVNKVSDSTGQAYKSSAQQQVYTASAQQQVEQARTGGAQQCIGSSCYCSSGSTPASWGNHCSSSGGCYCFCETSDGGAKAGLCGWSTN